MRESQADPGDRHITCELCGSAGFSSGVCTSSGRPTAVSVESASSRMATRFLRGCGPGWCRDQWQARRGRMVACGQPAPGPGVRRLCDGHRWNVIRPGLPGGWRRAWGRAHDRHHARREGPRREVYPEERRRALPCLVSRSARRRCRRGPVVDVSARQLGFFWRISGRGGATTFSILQWPSNITPA
jgi:hypothetical protein